MAGQFFQKGPVQTFTKLHPRFKGLAYIAAYMDFIVLSYYTIVIAWATLYFFQSWNWGGEVPWKHKFGGDTKRYFEAEMLGRKWDPQGDHGLGDSHARSDGGPVFKVVLALFFTWVLTMACLIKGR